MSKFYAISIAYLSFFIGISSFFVFMVFIFLGPLNLVDFGLNKNRALLINACLSIVFFVQHSIMIRRFFRLKLIRVLHDEYYGAFYSIISGILLFGVVVLWQRIPQTVFVATNISYWILRAVFFLCLAGTVWGFISIDSLDNFGYKRILSHINHKKPEESLFTVKGPYRWVRHPLYLFMILMIWSFPELTIDRLVFNLMWTIWHIIGIKLEERDLVYIFGNQYRIYQKNVPMIIPYKILSG